jgi:enediyne biosynthesis protein E4
MKKHCCIVLLLLVLFACKSKQAAQIGMFTTLPADSTNLFFNNKLTPNDTFNLFDYMYYYNGAGTGAADFNNDGKTDLFFAANQKPSKLFLNQGNLKFTDVTAQTQLPIDSTWSTGVSVVDINNDGLMDIYVCKVGNYKSLKSKNQLFVCQQIKNGIPIYKEDAASYGLDFSGFSTQAAFFDYDGDTDLDLFLLNHNVNHDGNYAPRKIFENTFDSLAGQRLYNNNSTVVNGKTISTFKNVTAQAGIRGTKIGYGLGIVVTDVNNDAWPDVYIGNDFHENDYLYINQKNGTFIEAAQQAFTHTSQFTMGVDAADINNDGFTDLVSMDMLPYDNKVLRKSLAEDDYTIYTEKIKYGYSYQYARNNLQKNNGNGTFTELGQYAGIYATDWSWATLFTDFNNDGKKDLFVSNGIPKRMNDVDYINFVTDQNVQKSLSKEGVHSMSMALTKKFPEIKLPNQFFLNEGNFKFSKVNDSVINNVPTFSNSAVYADFDNDGDEDIIVNNIEDNVVLYKNNTKNPAVQITLNGSANNINAIGAKVVVFTKNGVQSYEQQAVRGFLGSMQTPINIGLQTNVIDSMFVIWNYQKTTKVDISNIKNLKANFTDAAITLNYKPTVNSFAFTLLDTLPYQHSENDFIEFNREQLLTRMNSAEGPALAVGDINGDSLDDIFCGASKGYHNAIFIQKTNGKFTPLAQPQMYLDSMWENVDAAIVDINKDGKNDLVIASGGNEYYGNDEHLLPLVYINTGNGIMAKSANAIQGINTTQSCVRPFDFNGDGAMDLFIGSKAIPWAYGTPAKQYFLQNNGAGIFTDVTQTILGNTNISGMLTDAKWYDWNKDNQTDLLLCYEWGNITLLQKNNTIFTAKPLTTQAGLWNSIWPFTQNKNNFLLAFNLGANTKLQPTTTQPVNLYLKDFDDNGRVEAITTYYYNQQEIPFAQKHALEKQLPTLKKKFLLATDFANSSLDDLFGAKKLNEATKLSITHNQHTVFNSNAQTQLPWQLQLSNIKTATQADFNNDGQPDFLVAGNYYQNSVDLGRQDACQGNVLINNGAGNFTVLPIIGVNLSNAVRNIKAITVKGTQAYVSIANNGGVQIFTIQ